jgi:hypothetical protein
MESGVEQIEKTSFSNSYPLKVAVRDVRLLEDFLCWASEWVFVVAVLV